MPAPDLDAALWRSHRAATAFVRDLERVTLAVDENIDGASKILACINRHVLALRDAVKDVEFAEQAKRVIGAVRAAMDAGDD